MSNDAQKKPACLTELMESVRAELARSENHQQDQEPDLERERVLLGDKIDGWIKSLANKDLDSTVRHALESEWAAAEKRRQEIEQIILARHNRGQRAADAVDEATVLERLQTLSHVLDNFGATRANLELSLHIDRLTCYADGRIELRTCKLGAMPEVVELLLSNGDPRPLENGGRSDRTKGKRLTGPRRRGRLRTADCDDPGGAGAREIADFVADTNRFANLSEQWFWVDEFQVPVKRSWVEENADLVMRRRDEIEKETGKKPSLNILAHEFGVSRPTISTAIDIATGKRVPRHDRKREKRKFTAPLDEATRDEIVRLYHHEELELTEVGNRFGVHRSTVERILNAWDKKRGIKRPDGRKRRSRKRPADNQE